MTADTTPPEDAATDLVDDAINYGMNATAEAPQTVDYGQLIERAKALTSVPATNQAGEVESFVEQLRNRAECRDCMGYDATADQLRQAADMIERLAALATQPATSQEGEEPTCERCDRGVCVDPHYEDDDRLNRPAATPTPPATNEGNRP